MRNNSPRSIAVAAIFFLACGGCGSGEIPHAETIPIKGKITYRGKPLEKGVVTFEPTSTGREASGQIQPDGTFVLTTFKKDDGAVIGHHRVSVSGTGNGPGSKKKELVPLKYISPTTSKLETDVSAEKTDYSFDLK